MTEFLEYTIRILPGCLVIAVIYFLLPKNKMIEYKIFLLVMGFILIRDAMTPMGFWKFGLTHSVVWIRFTDNSFILIGLAVVSLILTFGIVYANHSMKHLLYWSSESKIKTIFAGILGACIVCLPLFVLYQFVDISTRGGTVSTFLLLPLLLMALAGNFMEEVLFRGYLQGYLQDRMKKWKTILFSGLFFSMGHIFLASTVTDLGAPILLFTLYEGLICAFVRTKYGILASTITHGLTIFVLSSGLI